jgi:hypothetical protein
MSAAEKYIGEVEVGMSAMFIEIFDFQVSIWGTSRR